MCFFCLMQTWTTRRDEYIKQFGFFFIFLRIASIRKTTATILTTAIWKTKRPSWATRSLMWTLCWVWWTLIFTIQCKHFYIIISFILINKHNNIYISSDLIFMDDSAEGRISLAYERLSRIPRPLADHFAQNTHTLDLSHNNIKYVYIIYYQNKLSWYWWSYTKSTPPDRDLSFLANFKHLNTLILDKNDAPEVDTLPPLPNLQILWYNFHIFYFSLRRKVWNMRNLRLLLILGWITAASTIWLNGWNAFRRAVPTCVSYLCWEIPAFYRHLTVELVWSIWTTGACVRANIKTNILLI